MINPEIIQKIKSSLTVGEYEIFEKYIDRLKRLLYDRSCAQCNPENYYSGFKDILEYCGDCKYVEARR